MNKEDLNLLDAVDVYKLVLERKLKMFPKAFWMKPEALDNARKCTIYLLEERLGFSEKDIKEKVTFKIIIENKLGGMAKICFNSSIYEVLNNAYPNKFKPWEFKKIVVGKWNEEKRKEAVKWLIEEKLKLSDEELKKKLSVKSFKENGLGGLLDEHFHSIYEAVNSVYPNKFKPWELENTKINYWSRELGVEATRWLIEEKLKLSDEELKNNFSSTLFFDNGLSKMLLLCFNNSPYDALNSVYPNKFKLWELKKINKGIWNKEMGKEAVKWLIEEKLKFSDEEIRNQLSVNLFKINGLGKMLKICFNSNIYEALNSVYPNKFKPWEFKSSRVNYWSNDLAMEATKWLIEEKLKFSEEDLKNKLSYTLFKDNGFKNMINICFNNDPYAAINSIYPNKYKREDFKYLKKYNKIKIKI